MGTGINCQSKFLISHTVVEVHVHLLTLSFEHFFTLSFALSFTLSLTLPFTLSFTLSFAFSFQIFTTEPIVQIGESGKSTAFGYSQCQQQHNC